LFKLLICKSEIVWILLHSVPSNLAIRNCHYSKITP